jgi:lipoprotein-releasing system permease protein
MQTVFIIVGVAIGVAVIVFMWSLMTGLQTNFVKELLASQPHIQLLPTDETARPLRTAAGVVEAATVQQPAQRPRSIDQWQNVLKLLRQRPTSSMRHRRSRQQASPSGGMRAALSRSPASSPTCISRS